MGKKKTFKEKIEDQLKVYQPKRVLTRGLISVTNYFVLFAIVILFVWGLSGLTDDHDEAFSTLEKVYGHMNTELAGVPIEDVDFTSEFSGLLDLNVRQIKSLILKFILLFSVSFFVFFLVNAVHHFFMWGRSGDFPYKTLFTLFFSRVFTYYLILNFVFFLGFIILLALCIVFFSPTVAAILVIISHLLYWYYSMFIRYRFFSFYKTYKEIAFGDIFVLIFTSFRLGFLYFFKIIKVLLALLGIFFISILLISFISPFLPPLFTFIISILYFILFLVFARSFYTLSVEKFHISELK
jgi:hypothetical protein